MVVQENLCTTQDLWEMAHGSAARRYELHKGVLIEMAPTGDMHGVVAAEVLRVIANFNDTHDLGEVTAAETGFVLSTDPDTVRAPDIAFIAKARLTPLTGKYYRMAPDLAVEVISPNESATDVDDKIHDYFNAGVKLVWLVYPNSRTVHVYTAADEVRIHKSGEVLDGGDILPQFKLPVDDVFKRLQR